MTDQAQVLDESTSEVESGTKKRGRLYWFGQNIKKSIGAFFRRHKILFVFLSVIGLVTLFVMRSWYHPYLLQIRIHSAEILVGIFLLVLLKVLWSRKRKKTAVTLVLVVGASVGGVTYLNVSPHDYMTLYMRYGSLKTLNFETFPETQYERIQPLNSIRTLSKEGLSDMERVADPDYVRVGDKYRYVMAIEPAYLVSRTTGSIKEIFNVSATSSSPSFDNKNREQVNFRTGEHLLFGSNSLNAATRSLGFLRYFSYEPLNVKHVKDDTGEWVQVVSLARWTGILFPYPEFGGVLVIRQNKSVKAEGVSDQPVEKADVVGDMKTWIGRHADAVLSRLELIFLGDGEWIPPEEVKQHAFLRRQNIVPYKVSRYMGESFRFKAGFLAPAPGYHKGDIRIPAMKGDVNEQPYTTYFQFSEDDTVMDNKLYHYFALEPFDPDKQGMNTSLFIPADGIGPIGVYRHSVKKESRIGVSAVPAKVMESKKNYDWTHNAPVEHRPYARVIDGKLRLFWLTTVVTLKETQGGDVQQFIAGTDPEVVLTDTEYKKPVWVDSGRPETWEAQLKETLGSIWKAN